NVCRPAPLAASGGVFQSRTFCGDSEDWVRLPACAGRSYTIETSALGPLADTVLELYAPDCSALLAWDDDGGGGLASRIDWIAPASGQYGVRVFQKDGMVGRDRTY